MRMANHFQLNLLWYLLFLECCCSCVSCRSLNFLIWIVDPPSVKINRKEVIVVEGHNTSLTCNVSGKPEPTITWTKQGSGVVLSNTSSLDVLNVSRHDATDDIIQYQCKASNGVGTPATATVNVTVYCKYYRFILYLLPLGELKFLWTVAKKNFYFCKATGNPQSNISWPRQVGTKTCVL